MKPIFAIHRLRWVAGCLLLGILGWFLLRFAVVRSNDRFTVHDLPARPYAESVAVEPGAPLFFTWGVTAGPRTKSIGQLNLPEAERFGDTYTQAHSVLSQLNADLAEVGLTVRDVVNVRAYLVGDETAPPDFEAWDRAFGEYFGTALTPHKPARTTVGISRLFIAQYRIEVEFVAVFPDGRGPFIPGSRPFRVHERLQRIETSEVWKSYGRQRFPMSTGKALRGGDVLFFSSALLPRPMNPTMPAQFWMYGMIQNQAASIFAQTGSLLTPAGAGYPDLFFMRTIMFPEDGKPIGPNFGIFNREYTKVLNNEANPNRPTRTVMSAPGFTYRKQLMALELYGAIPAARSRIDFADAPVHRVKLGDAPGSDLVAVAPEAGLEFFSGMLAPEAKGDVAAEAEAILTQLDEKLAARGMDRGNLVHLRAYLVGGNQPAAAVAAWETVYAAHFGTPAQPFEPALTTLPVVGLPEGRTLALEILAARSAP
jgi:enamine deaminase RidA (YjgF/YER057c/UK114 family)